MTRKTLGEIAYEGAGNAGWASATPTTRCYWRRAARAVERAVLSRKAKSAQSVPIGADHGHRVTRPRGKAGAR